VESQDLVLRDGTGIVMSDGITGEGTAKAASAVPLEFRERDREERPRRDEDDDESVVRGQRDFFLRCVVDRTLATCNFRHPRKARVGRTGGGYAGLNS